MATERRETSSGLDDDLNLDVNLDFGIHKNFPITERLNSQFRFEAFNAINRVNLNSPNTSVTSSNFMRITSAGSPRILQFALRLNW